MVSGGCTVRIPLLFAVALLAPALSRAQVGACCLPDGTCTRVERSACAGTFLGEGTNCGPGVCHGACCLPDEMCERLTQTGCASRSGTFLRFDAQCELPRRICPGACDGVLTGDCDGDGRIANFDIDAFVLAISDPSGYLEQVTLQPFAAACSGSGGSCPVCR